MWNATARFTSPGAQLVVCLLGIVNVHSHLVQLIRYFTYGDYTAYIYRLQSNATSFIMATVSSFSLPLKSKI